MVDSATDGQTPAPAPGWRRHLGKLLLGAFVLLLAGSWLAAAAHALLMMKVHPEEHLIHGHDDRHYFATAVGLWIEGDLDFDNQFERLLPEMEIERTPTGRVANKYGIGMPLLAAPPMLLTRVVGFDSMGNGAQLLYVLWLAALGMAAVAITAMVLARICGGGPAMIAAGSMLLGTSLLWYTVLQPTMSHAVTVFWGALILWGWERRYLALDARLRWPVLMGIAIGMSASTRWQDAPLAVIVAVGEAGLMWSRRRGDGTDLKRVVLPSLTAATIAALAFFAGAFPMLLYQKLLYGSWWINAYAERGEHFDFANPALGGLLFSTRNSLYFYAPLTLLATTGLWGATTLDARKTAWAALAAAFFVNVYVNASWWAWTMGHSFGARGLLNSWVPLAAGLAWLLMRARRWSPRARWILAIAIAFSIAWCLLMMVLYETSSIPHDGSGWDVLTLPARVSDMAWKFFDKAMRAVGMGV